ncbi:DUF1572 domain-containing protein [Echinicola marina]|uniref:DinB family protein n=1 Tax=Echinicola marina TaxID=2859768 RepID=UPI001CF65F87|nr:DinB family protein [Echinicola marina]UCS94522.1 DUF1572 domain-containing protein [Echinicola marina]
MDNNPIGQELIKHAIFRLNENKAKIISCLDWLTEEEIWQRPNEVSNSIGNLVLHLAGNLGQYIVSSLGGHEDKRDRDAEFSACGGMSKSALIHLMNKEIKVACETLETISEKDLISKYNVQGFRYTGVGNVLHAVEHFSYHTGQIAFWTKIVREQDLGFYAGIDLNKKNEGKE